MTMTCGIDWAERHHDVALMDPAGVVVARRRISDDLEGLRQLQELLGAHTVNPTAVRVAIETDRGLLVAALRAGGHTVHVINPRAVARYRERHGQAGGKSDPADAIVLANILRTDGHLHRALPDDTELAKRVRVLARQHQEAIWARQQTVNRLRTLLHQFFPAALRAFPDLTHRAALTVLAAAPTPTKAAALSRRRVIALLRRSGRGNRPGLADTLVATFQAPALRQPGGVESAMGLAAAGLIEVIVAMHEAIVRLETELHGALAAHPQHQLLASMPGLGPTLGGRVLAELGDDRDRFGTAAGLRAFAGTAPITRTSGRYRAVTARHVRNRRLADACHWWAFAALTKSPGARAHYDRRRAAGETHNAALRNLANKLLGRLWWCLQQEQRYDETIAWPDVPPVAA
jgi:transposase